MDRAITEIIHFQSPGLIILTNFIFISYRHWYPQTAIGDVAIQVTKIYSRKVTKMVSMMKAPRAL